MITLGIRKTQNGNRFVFKRILNSENPDEWYAAHSEESEHLGIRWIAEYENKNWNRQTKMNIICEYGHYDHMSIEQALKDLRIDSPAGKGE